jgi:hypothetical protein
MRNESHCSHLQENTLQPMAVFTDNQGKQFFRCMFCTHAEIETLGHMSPAEIAGLISFSHCGHVFGERLGFCSVCRMGVCCWLTAQAAHMRFYDKAVSSRLRHIVDDIAVMTEGKKPAYRMPYHWGKDY